MAFQNKDEKAKREAVEERIIDHGAFPFYTCLREDVLSAISVKRPGRALYLT